jgi:hypothetical protein
MKIETREVYKCDHCNKLYQIKNPCITHEKICTKNPDNKRDCFGCDYLDKKEAIVKGDGYLFGDTKANRLFCSKFKTFLYPPKIEYYKSYDDIEGFDNNAMPKECLAKKVERIPF